MKVAEVSSKRVLEIKNQVKRFLAKQALSLNELSEMVQSTPTHTKKVLLEMQRAAIPIQQRSDGRFSLVCDLEPGGLAQHTIPDRGDGWQVIGHTADNHLCSKHERLDVLNWGYDIFAEEGVTNVYNGGNWLEGECRINRHDIKIFGLEAQADYFVENYPQRKGMTTHYVSGNDHEGWWNHREQINIGKFVEAKAYRAGRQDLHYLGNVEADVKLVCGRGSAVMKIMHGGGGNAYALSYVLQKTVEAFQGGEKPSILHVGHHHKFCYCYPRNVHAFMPGCTEDQSIFMRTRKIEAHVGIVLTRFKQDKKDGHITQFELRWVPFYDRGYYRKSFE